MALYGSFAVFLFHVWLEYTSCFPGPFIIYCEPVVSNIRHVGQSRSGKDSNLAH